MISRREIQETNRMIAEMNLDVRTITMGISLFDCIDSDITVLCDNLSEDYDACEGLGEDRR